MGDQQTKVINIFIGLLFNLINSKDVDQLFPSRRYRKDLSI